MREPMENFAALLTWEDEGQSSKYQTMLLARRRVSSSSVSIRLGSSSSSACDTRGWRKYRYRRTRWRSRKLSHPRRRRKVANELL